MSPATSDVMRCGVHADVPAVDTCSRCGSFVCGDCLELIGEEPFCQACYHRKDVTGRASTRATLALLFGATGLLCGAPFGIIALVLAWRERIAVEQGRSPLSSRTLANVARTLGWISVVLTGVLLLGLAGFIAWGVYRSAPVTAPVK